MFNPMIPQGKMTSRFVCVLLVVLSVVRAQEGYTDQSSERNAYPKQAVWRDGVLLLERAQTGEERRLGAFIEAYLAFRFAASPALDVVSVDVPGRKVPSYRSAREAVPKNAYESVCAEYGVSHVLSQTCGFAHDGSGLEYLVELVRRKDGRVVGEFDRKFPAERLTVYLDSAAQWVKTTLGVPRRRSERRFYDIQVAPLAIRDQMALGQAILQGATDTSQGAAAQAAERLMGFVAKDARQLVAQYFAGQFFAQANKYDRAARIHHEMIDVLPDHAGLYTSAARNLRLSGNVGPALKIAMMADRGKIASVPLLVEKGLSEDALGKETEAIETFSRILEEDDSQPDALVFQARKRNDAKDYTAALGHTFKALQTQPDNLDALVEKGRSLANLNKTGEAMKVLRQVVSRLPRDARAYVYLGDLYAAQGLHKTAADNYEKAVIFAPGDLDVVLKAVDAATQAGATDRAYRLLKRVEKNHPSSMEIQKRTAMIAMAQGDTATAYRHLYASHRMDENDGEVLVALGDVHVGRGEMDKAFYYYNHALNSMKDKGPAQLAMAGFYLRKGEPAAALRQINSINPGARSAVELDRYRGDALYALGEKKKALASYLKQRQKDPGSIHVQKQIARIYYELDERKDALSEYKLLARLDPRDTEPGYRMAVLGLKDGQTSTAKQLIEETRRKAEPNAEQAVEIADAFAGLQQTNQAARYYNKALATAGTREQVLVKLGRMYTRNNEDSSAAECFLKLAKIDPDKHEDKLVKAAHIFKSLGLEQRARDAYSHLIRGGSVDPGIHTGQAGILFKDGKHDSVVMVLQRVEDKIQDDAEALSNYATSLSKINSHAKAADIFSKVARMRPSDVQALELGAREYEKAGQLQKAISLYRNLLDLAPGANSAEYAFKIGELYEQLGKPQLAGQQYEANLREYPGDVRNHVRLSKLYADDGDDQRSLQVLSRAIELPGCPPEMQKRLARLHLDRGEHADAAANYLAYLKSAPADSTAWYELGLTYYQSGDFAGAIDPLSRASALMPENFDAVYRLARSHKNIAEETNEPRNLERAITFFEQASELDSTGSDVLAHLADCYRMAKDRRGLVDALRRWAARSPESFTLTSDIVGDLLDAGYMSEVIEALEGASAQRPDNVRLHVTLADLHTQNGAPDKARKHLEDALVHDPRNVEVLYRLGRHYSRARDYAKAERYLRKAIEIDPEKLSCQFEYGLVLRELGRKEEALRHLALAVQGDPGNAAYAWEHSRLAESLDKVSDALETATKAWEVDPDNARLSAWVGYLHYRSGNADTAIGIIEKAVKKDSLCYECHGWHGDVLFAQKQYERAAKSFGLAVLDTSAEADTLLFKKGRAHELDRDYPNAQQAFEQVLSYKPEHQETLYRLVHTHVMQGESDKGSRVLDKYEPEEKEGWYFLAQGEVLEADSALMDAYKAYSTASRHLPASGVPLAGCARINAKHRDFSSAVKYLGKAASLEPRNAEYLLQLGNIYHIARDQESEKHLYREMVRRRPDVGEGYYHLARLLIEEGDRREGMKVLQKGLRQAPQLGKLYELAGSVYQSMKRIEDALVSYEYAVEYGGDDCLDAYRRMGLIYYHDLEDDKQALKAFREYRKGGGEDSDVDRIVRRLSR